VNYEDFKKAVASAVLWIQEHGTPHDCIIVEQDGAVLYEGKKSEPFKIKD
jgi:hypothetical protein